MEIELLPPSAGAVAIERVTALVNQVYAEAEKGLWRLEDATGEFGVLAADPARRGLGIGRELVRHAEQACRDAGCREMQLELLRVTHRADLAEDYPHLAPSPATPCDFLVYRKALA